MFVQVLRLLVIHCSVAYSLQTAELATPQNVQVELYAESLCPFCARFTQQVLAPMFANGLSDIVDLDIIMYGNAHDASQGPICQHGPQECALNKVINCAIDLNPGQNRWFSFVECIEANISKGVAVEKSCAEQLGIDDAPIKACTGGSQGDELIVSAAKRTGALVPPHTYVPWVLVNGVPLGDSASNLATVVCAAYQGKRPSVCFEEPAASKDNDDLLGLS